MRRWREPECDVATLTALEMFDLVFGTLKFELYRVGPAREFFPYRGEQHSAGASFEQDYAQIALKFGDAACHTRLRDAEVARRRADTPPLGDSYKVANLMKLHVTLHKSSLTEISPFRSSFFARAYSIDCKRTTFVRAVNPLTPARKKIQDAVREASPVFLHRRIIESLCVCSCRIQNEHLQKAMAFARACEGAQIARGRPAIVGKYAYPRGRIGRLKRPRGPIVS